jgi:hypothetical protein
MNSESAEPRAAANDVTPEELVNDYLIGAYEIEKLRNGFIAPVIEGDCAEPRALRSESDDSR